MHWMTKPMFLWIWHPNTERSRQSNLDVLLIHRKPEVQIRKWYDVLQANKKSSNSAILLNLTVIHSFYSKNLKLTVEKFCDSLNQNYNVINNIDALFFLLIYCYFLNEQNI
jgi:hypothetical protein